MHVHTQRQLPALIIALWLILAGSGGAASAPAPEQELQAARALAQAAIALAPEAKERATVRRLFAALEQTHPQDVAVKNAFAEFLWSIGESDDALRRWREAAQVAPRNALVLNHLGGAHLSSGNTREALRCFTEAAAVEPTNPLYHFNLANVAFLFRQDLGMPEEKAFALAMRHFADATERAPADAEYARAYAEAFYTVPNADWCTALAAWQNYHDLAPGKDFALVNLARVHMKLGQKAEARDCLARVNAPEFARIKRRLSERIDRE